MYICKHQRSSTTAIVITIRPCKREDLIFETVNRYHHESLADGYLHGMEDTRRYSAVHLLTFLTLNSLKAIQIGKLNVILYRRGHCVKPAHWNSLSTCWRKSERIVRRWRYRISRKSRSNAFENSTCIFIIITTVHYWRRQNRGSLMTEILHLHNYLQVDLVVLSH